MIRRAAVAVHSTGARARASLASGASIASLAGAPSQATLARRVRFAGVGLHSGEQCAAEVLPAEPHAGIAFVRVHSGGSPAALPVRARFDSISATELCTSIGHGSARVSTIEHLMAALYSAGIDNALVKVTGPEVPILDGSSALFCSEIAAAGIEHQCIPASRVRVARNVRVADGDRWAELHPLEPASSSTQDLLMSVEVHFPHPCIGQQRITASMPAWERFQQEIASARTFCMKRDVDDMRSRGLAKGGSLENALVFDESPMRITNPGGLRFPDEVVRHKLLDCIGDLALAGNRLQASYSAYKPGHKLNAWLLQELFRDASNYHIA
eukprot:tig00021352_g20732.t1